MDILGLLGFSKNSGAETVPEKEATSESEIAHQGVAPVSTMGSVVAHKKKLANTLFSKLRNTSSPFPPDEVLVIPSTPYSTPLDDTSVTNALHGVNGEVRAPAKDPVHENTADTNGKGHTTALNEQVETPTRTPSHIAPLVEAVPVNTPNTISPSSQEKQDIESQPKINHTIAQAAVTASHTSEPVPKQAHIRVEPPSVTTTRGTDLSDLRHRVLLESIKAPAPAAHLPELPPDMRPSAPLPISPVEVMPNVRHTTVPSLSTVEAPALISSTNTVVPPTSLPSMSEDTETPAHEEATPLEPVPTPTPQPVRSTVRTFATDVTSLMADPQVSVVRAIAEEERKRQEIARVGYESVQEATSRARLYYLLGVSSVLFALATGVLLYIFVLSETPLDIVVEYAATGYFPPDEQENIDITGKNRSTLIDNLVTARDQVNLRSGGVTQLVLTTQLMGKDGELYPSVVSSKEVLNILEAKIPNELAQTLVGTPMIGVFEESSNNLFIVFTVNDYNKAFDAMLKWEPKLVSDLGPLLNSSIGNIAVITDTSLTQVPVREATSTATSTLRNATTTKSSIGTSTNLFSGQTRAVPTYRYTGRIITNKETRVLENTDDRSVAFLWSLVDREHLILTPSDSVFVEINRRIVNAQ